MTTLDDMKVKEINSAKVGGVVVISKKLAVKFVKETGGYTYIKSTGKKAEYPTVAGRVKYFKSLEVAKKHFLNFVSFSLGF